MQFHALVEEWPGESMVYFRELPGCFASAPTTEAALQAAPQAIEKYFRWLKENGITLFDGEVGPIGVTLTERVSSVEGEAGPFFEADQAAPNDLEIDNSLNVAATARALIIELVANVPSHLHTQVPPAGGWSLTQHLLHIMECETWYVSRLLEQPEEEPPTTLTDADNISMKIFENAMDYEVILRELTSEQRSRVLTHGREQWSAAKVLRRMAGHLREHYQWMEEMVEQFSAR
jgi:predicted RNase H-like HicB family nuclease